MAKQIVLVMFISSFVCLKCAVSSPSGDAGSARGSESSEEGLLAGINVLYRTYQQCEGREDMFSCLKLKALKFADRAMKVKSIPLIDGIALVKKDDDGSRQINEPLVEIDESKLPADPEKKRDVLDNFLIDRLSRFLRTHSVQFSVPKFISELEETFFESEKREETQEGRAKLKKYGGAILLGMLMKGGMMAMAYKGIALLAGKALLVAKIALVLSAVIGLKKLVSSGGEEKVTYEIVKHPHVSHAHTYSHEHYDGGHFGASGGGGGEHYRRSLEAPPHFYPHMMAYRGQLPEGVATAKPSQ